MVTASSAYPLFRSIRKGGNIRGRLRDGGVSQVLEAHIAWYLEVSGYSRDEGTPEIRRGSTIA